MFSGDLEPKRGILSWRWNDTKILGNNGGNPWRVGVRACMPAFCLIGIRMVIIGIRLQTWMRVVVDVDV